MLEAKDQGGWVSVGVFVGLKCLNTARRGNLHVLEMGWMDNVHGLGRE